MLTKKLVSFTCQLKSSSLEGAGLSAMIAV